MRKTTKEYKSFLEKNIAKYKRKIEYLEEEQEQINYRLRKLFYFKNILHNYKEDKFIDKHIDKFIDFLEYEYLLKNNLFLKCNNKLLSQLVNSDLNNINNILYCIKDLICYEKEKKEINYKKQKNTLKNIESLKEKLTALIKQGIFNKDNFKLSTMLLSIAIIIGFIYNYYLFNYKFKIDVFNFIEIEDFIMSWISNEDLILIVFFIIVISFLTYLIYEKDFLINYRYPTIENNKKNKFFIGIFFIIYLVLIYYNTDNTFYYLLLTLGGYLLFNLVILLLFKASENERPNFLTLFFVFLFTLLCSSVIAADKYADTLLKYNDKNACQVKLIRQLDPLDRSFYYQFIGRTSSSSFFLVHKEGNADIKYIQVINNSDIAHISFLKKIQTNDKADKDTTSFQINEEKDKYHNSQNYMQPYKYQKTSLNDINTNTYQYNFPLSMQLEQEENNLQEAPINPWLKLSIFDKGFEFNLLKDTSLVDKVNLLSFNNKLSINPKFKFNKDNEFTNISYQLSKIHPSLFLYFDKKSFLINENLLVNKKLLKEHQRTINYLKSNFSNNKRFIIEIIGSSSLENIKKNDNTIKDNYTLAMARANSTKKYIINILLKEMIDPTQVAFFIFSESNQDKDKNHSRNRNVRINIYEYIKPTNYN